MKNKFVLTYEVVLLLSYRLRPVNFLLSYPNRGLAFIFIFFPLFSAKLCLSDALNRSQIDVAHSNFNLVTGENAKSLKSVRPLRLKIKMLEKKTFKLNKMITFTSGSSM